MFRIHCALLLTLTLTSAFAVAPAHSQWTTAELRRNVPISQERS